MNLFSKHKSVISELLKCIYIVFSFFALDVVLRILTRWLGYYSIYELPPSLFSLCWAVIFLVLLSLLPKKTARIVYACLYGLWAIYTVVQYVYYLIFDKFLFISDFTYAAEGGDYFDYVADILNIKVFASAILFIAIGIIGFFLFPDVKKISVVLKRNIARSGVAAISLICMFFIPSMYTDSIFPFFSSKYEYEQFTNSGFDMEITGLYQYVARDVWCSYLKPGQDPSELKNTVDAYLEAKPAHEANEKTGILEGKNVLLIQMETMDDWIINTENTPTISQLMNEGINFTNMYTCLYGSGWTFSTEFAFNSGIYQSTKGIAAYSLSQNLFPYSIANIFAKKNYSCNSFHENTPNFYSRSSIHPALGYERYYNIAEFFSEYTEIGDDELMISNDACWKKITAKQPFLSFLITISAHVPFSSDNEVVKYALNKYPQYNISNRDPELNALYAKARLTDDMFSSILRRLEEDGLIDNTVIIAYSDHYCYGLTNKETVYKLSEENGSSILEKTPAFIWYKGCTPESVDKICQTVDWVPTIANLFGEDVVSKVLGNDIFDPSYEGIAIFPDGTWLTEDCYAVNGIPQNDNSLSSEEVADTNKKVKAFYEANEAILESDYYSLIS